MECWWVALAWVWKDGEVSEGVVSLLHTVYLSVVDIANPDLFACSCQTWISLDIAAYMSSNSSHPVCLHGRLAQKRQIGPHSWGREVSTQFSQRFARPL